MKERTKRVLLYIFLLVSILFLIILFTNDALSNYKLFRANQNYFQNNTNTIQDWMTPNTILRHFNISQQELFTELNITNKMSNLRTPLKTLCQKNNLNCTKEIEKLNSLVG